MTTALRILACGLLLLTVRGSGGADCGLVDDSLGDLCTWCMADVGGVHFHCDEPHTYLYCQ